MKVLLYGKEGWIGEKVYEILLSNGHEVVIGTCRAENNKELEAEIISIRPTNIISTIGRTHGTIGDTKYTTIDYLEQKGKVRENVRDNLFSPLMLTLERVVFFLMMKNILMEKKKTDLLNTRHLIFSDLHIRL